LPPKIDTPAEQDDRDHVEFQAEPVVLHSGVQPEGQQHARQRAHQPEVMTGWS